MADSASRQFATRAYVAFVVALAVAALCGWSYYVGLSLSPTTLMAGLVLGAVCVVARFFPVGFGLGKASFEVVDMLFLSALVFGGPACALLVAAPSMVYRDPLRTSFQGATHIVQILAGAATFALFGSEPLLLAPHLSLSFVYGTLAAGLAMFGLDAVIGPVLMRLKYGLSLNEILKELVLPPLPSNALAIATTLATALAVASYNPLAVLTLVSGGILSLATIKRIREHNKRVLRMEAENAALKSALRDSNLEFASRLVEKLGLRDGHAAAHSAASAVYAGDIAKELALGEEQAQEVRLAALLQDVGLLYVSDEILLTHPDKLNSLGRMRLEEHPVSGETILSTVPGLEEVARWVRWHHERVDGTGYPDRLPEEWIPLEAKILAAASLYAALILDSPHSPGLSPDKARLALVGEMSKAVDGLIVKVFLRILDSEGETYASASDDRFSIRAERKAKTSTFTREPLRTIRLED